MANMDRRITDIESAVQPQNEKFLALWQDPDEDGIYWTGPDCGHPPPYCPEPARRLTQAEAEQLAAGVDCVIIVNWGPVRPSLPNAVSVNWPDDLES